MTKEQFQEIVNFAVEREEEAERFWKSEQEEAKRILFNPASGLFEVENLSSYAFPEASGGEK